ncbi:MAG TPA: response regulator [Candidatus Nitrosotenuis sp.]|nr:response regulator [Candidatus Nitrosotenuis sp.]
MADPITRVLIAEDDPDVRQVLGRILARQGYEVREAASGVEAWEIMQGPDPPSLLLLDWMMPGMDGVELCSLLRTRQDGPPVYIILLTARAGTDTIVEGLEAGADDIVLKPYERLELEMRVRVGERSLAVQRRLARKVEKLQEALAQASRPPAPRLTCALCNQPPDKGEWYHLEMSAPGEPQTRRRIGLCRTCSRRALDAEILQYFA